MIRTWLQAGPPHLAQPTPDGDLIHGDREASGDLGARIDAAPAHDFVHLGVRTLQHDLARFRQLRGRQSWLRAWRLARDQAIHTAFVEAEHPITQGLAIHAGLPRDVRPRCPFQDQRQGKQPTRLATILAACGDGTELIGCVVNTRDFDSRAMRSSFAANHRFWGSESYFAAVGNRSHESGTTKLGMSY